MGSDGSPLCDEVSALQMSWRNSNLLICLNFSIVRSGDAIYVRVGDYDLTRKYGSPGAQTLRVATTYIHHNHNSQTLDNDIALLKLHGQAELRDGVCLVSWREFLYFKIVSSICYRERERAFLLTEN